MTYISGRTGRHLTALMIIDTLLIRNLNEEQVIFRIEERK